MKQMNDDLMIDESDEYLLRVTNQLKEELQDIKVSEDLIARTLERTKEKGKQEAKLLDRNLEQMNPTKEDTKVSMLKRKSSMRWVTTVAGVVAACFVLMIGSKVLFGGFSNSKEDSSAESKTEYKDANTESSLGTDSQAIYDASGEDVASENATSQEVTSKDVSSEEHETLNEEQAFTSQNSATTEGEVLYSQKPTIGGTGEIDLQKVTCTANSGEVKEITGMSITAYEDAIAMGATNEQIYVYQTSDNETQAQSLLELFSSEQMKLTSEEATDTWDSYIILSMEEESAILYRIGNNHQVAVNVFGDDGKSQDVVYEVEDMKLFCESIKLILNEN